MTILKVLKFVIIISGLLSLSGCAGIGASAGIQGAGILINTFLNSYNVYKTLELSKQRYIIYSDECKWYLEVKLTDGQKLSMSESRLNELILAAPNEEYRARLGDLKAALREFKEKVVVNNILYTERCAPDNKDKNNNNNNSENTNNTSSVKFEHSLFDSSLPKIYNPLWKPY